MSQLEDLKSSVSRETLDLLTAYSDLVHQWNPRINLVSKSQLSDLWDRHIWDSAQVYPLLPEGEHVVDLGSGGGFPALVLACCSLAQQDGRRYTLIESDTRKSVFLRTVIRALGLDAKVVTDRWERTKPLNANVITARALASLDQLLHAACYHLGQDGVAIFPKGATWRSEIEESRRNWTFRETANPSITNPNASILCIQDIRRA